MNGNGRPDPYFLSIADSFERMARALEGINSGLHRLIKMEQQDMRSRREQMQMMEQGIADQSKVIDGVEALINNFVKTYNEAAGEAEADAAVELLAANSRRLGALVEAGTPADAGTTAPPPAAV